MRESGSPEILAPRETDCGEDWECRAAQISAKAMSASKFWTSDDRAPRGRLNSHRYSLVEGCRLNYGWTFLPVCLLLGVNRTATLRCGKAQAGGAPSS